LILIKLLIILLPVARLPRAQTKLKASFDETTIENLRTEDYSWLVRGYSDGGHRDLELVLKVLLEVLI
jgi:hypothetical protein